MLVPRYVRRHMSAILPMSVYIPMALAKFGDRLTRLPPTHMLRTLPLSNAVARYRSSLEPRTCITRLAPSTNFSPPFSFPAHPALHGWSHDCLREVLRSCGLNVRLVQMLGRVLEGDEGVFSDNKDD